MPCFKYGTMMLVFEGTIALAKQRKAKALVSMSNKKFGINIEEALTRKHPKCIDDNRHLKIDVYFIYA
jgi:hypothetical protein